MVRIISYPNHISYAVTDFWPCRHCSTAHPRSKLFYTSEFQYSDFDVFNGLLIGITSLDQKPDKFQTTLIQEL